MEKNSSARLNGRPVSPTLDGNHHRRVLNTWKEIAAHMGRAVRTIQRYERDSNLPVHRVKGAEYGSVMAFSDEIDTWLNRPPMKERRYVRPTLLVMDRVFPGSISIRKLVLETAYFNVLTAYSAEEAYSTADRFDVDGFVLDQIPGLDSAEEVCEALRERYPKKPIFAMLNAAESPAANGDAARTRADYLILDNDAQQLLIAVLEVFGTPRLT
jgi:CheY-like chemotaxis protein